MLEIEELPELLNEALEDGEGDLLESSEALTLATEERKALRDPQGVVEAARELLGLLLLQWVRLAAADRLTEPLVEAEALGRAVEELHMEPVRLTEAHGLADAC